jgi:hypothetical protein
MGDSTRQQKNTRGVRMLYIENIWCAFDNPKDEVEDQASNKYHCLSFKALEPMQQQSHI